MGCVNLGKKKKVLLSLVRVFCFRWGIGGRKGEKRFRWSRCTNDVMKWLERYVSPSSSVICLGSSCKGSRPWYIRIGCV